MDWIQGNWWIIPVGVMVLIGLFAGGSRRGRTYIVGAGRRRRRGGQRCPKCHSSNVRRRRGRHQFNNIRCRNRNTVLPPIHRRDKSSGVLKW